MTAARVEPLPIVVLISGTGTNLQAIMDAIAAGRLPATIRAVISDRPGAYGLTRAQRAGISAELVERRPGEDRAAYDRTLRGCIDSYRPGLVVLAGFMRILSAEFIRHYEGRILNIHPSLLPEFPGLHTHQRALQAGVAEHGASVHFVTEELDGGPVIVQARIPITPEDDSESIMRKVQQQEYLIYPLAIRWFAEGRVRQRGNTVLFDGRPLARPIDHGALAAQAPDGDTRAGGGGLS